MQLVKKTIVITGSSSGIGRGIVEHLAHRNNNLCLFARNESALQELKSRIESAGSRCEIFVGDLRKPNEIAEAHRQFRQKFSAIDAVILSAGVSEYTHVDHLRLDHGQEMMEVNYFGALHWIDRVLPEMVERKSGLIAAVTALGSFRGMPAGGFYCASKAALTSFLESIRLDLRSSQIQVSTILPGFVDTPMARKYDYHMPMMWDVPKAAKHIVARLESGHREIAFPWLLAFVTKLLRAFPPALYDSFFAKIAEEARAKGKAALSRDKSAAGQ